MLITAAMLRSDLVWNALTRRRPQDVVGSGGVPPRRAPLSDGVFIVCIFAVAGLMLLASLFMLLSWVTVSVPARELKSCSDFEGCVAPATDASESSWADDPLADRLKMTR